MCDIDVFLIQDLNASKSSDLGLGGGFRQILRFPPLVSTGQSQPSCNLPEKVTNN